MSPLLPLRVAGPLLVAACLAVPAAAETTILRDKQIEPYLQRLYQQFQVTRQNNQPPSNLLNEYARLEGGAGSARERAAYIHCRGTLLGWLGRPTEARTEMERSLQAYPHFPASHVAIALIDLKAKHFDGARSHLQQALRIQSDHLRATIYFAQLYRMLSARGDTRDNLEKAIRLYRRSVEEIEPTGQALLGLSGTYLELAKVVFDEEEAERCRERALTYAQLWQSLEPRNGQAHLHVARVHVALGDYEQAVASLEESYRADLEDGTKVAILFNLLDYYGGLNQPDRIEEVLRRILGHESVQGEQRARAEKMLADVRESGRSALLIWMVDAHLEILRNDGLSVPKRREALRRLLDLLVQLAGEDSERMRELQGRVFAEAFRTSLKEAPPELTVEFLRWLREAQPNPRLIRILVFYLYPNDDEWRTPAVRIEAVRAIGDSAGLGGLIPLFYALNDDDGAVLRATDQVLARLCGQRSPVGEGIAPLDAEQTVACRRFWYRFRHGDEGNEVLRRSIEELRECVDLDVSFNRENATQPIIDALAQVVLLDGDLDFATWQAGYAFFVDYMGKDLRPVGQRGTPVTPAQREAVTKAVAEWLGR